VKFWFVAKPLNTALFIILLKPKAAVTPSPRAAIITSVPIQYFFILSPEKRFNQKRASNHSFPYLSS
jgi:hypothetical protein